MKCRVTTVVNPGLSELPKQLTEWSATEMKKVTKDMDIVFRNQRARVFATEGGEAGGRWPALSPAYAKQKARAYPGRKIMQKKGGLRRSLAQKGAGHVARYTGGKTPSVTLGTDVKVAAYHIKPKAGIPNPLYNKNLPDRDVMEHMPKHIGPLKATFRPYWEAKLKRALRFMITKQAEMRRRAGGGSA